MPFVFDGLLELLGVLDHKASFRMLFRRTRSPRTCWNTAERKFDRSPGLAAFDRALRLQAARASCSRPLSSGILKSPASLVRKATAAA